MDDLLLRGYVTYAVRLHAAGRYNEDEVKNWLTTLANGLAWQGRHGKSGSDIRLDDWWLPDGHTGNHALGAALGPAAGLTAGITAALAGAPHWDASLLIADTTDTGNGGASAWTRYCISVLAGKLRQRGPLRFAEFLDWAQRAGLLRVLGIAYQFRHRQLQDLLTTASPNISIDADETATQS